MDDKYNKLVKLSVEDICSKFAEESVRKTLSVFLNDFMISLIKDSMYNYFYNKAFEHHKVVEDYFLSKISLKDDIDENIYDEKFDVDDIVEDLANPFVDDIIDDIIPKKHWVDVEDGYYDLSASNNLNYKISYIFLKKICIKYTKINIMFKNKKYYLSCLPKDIINLVCDALCVNKQQ